LRKPHVGAGLSQRLPNLWLQRFWLRLMLAGLACCLTSQLGPGQAPVIGNRGLAVLEPPLPIIVNRTPALPESPQDVENALPAVLEFEPSGAPLPPIPSVLVFEPAEAPAPMISGAPGLAANRPPLPALSSERALRPGKAPLPAIPYLLSFRASTPTLPSQSSSPDFEPSAPPLPPLSNVPVFTSPLAILSDHPLAALSQRAAFGSVIGLEGSNGVDNRTTFLCPMKAGFAEPFVLRESPVQIKDTNPRTANFSDPIPQSISLPQPLFRLE
jgi:hypothetical protein